MGYVDEANLSLWRFRVACHFRKRARPKKIVNFVNIVATSSWVQHQCHSDLNGFGKNHQLILYDFRAYLTVSLCRARATHLDRLPCAPLSKRPRAGPKANTPPKDVRLDGITLWPVGLCSENRGIVWKSKPVTKIFVWRWRSVKNAKFISESSSLICK